MKTSEKIDLISKALVAAQKEIKPAVKDSKNPFFNSTYADLSAVIDAVKDPLGKNGLTFIQLVHSDETDKVETILLHESGQYISTETRVYCTKPNDPQAFGSGITYTKRYALQAALGIATEDDDGNKASDKHVDKPSAKKTEQPANTAKAEMDELLDKKPAAKTTAIKPESDGLTESQLAYCQQVKEQIEANSGDHQTVNFILLKTTLAEGYKKAKKPMPPATDATQAMIDAVNVMKKYPYPSELYIKENQDAA